MLSEANIYQFWYSWLNHFQNYFFAETNLLIIFSNKATIITLIYCQHTYKVHYYLYTPKHIFNVINKCITIYPFSSKKSPKGAEIFVNIYAEKIKAFRKLLCSIIYIDVLYLSWKIKVIHYLQN